MEPGSEYSAFVLAAHSNADTSGRAKKRQKEGTHKKKNKKHVVALLPPTAPPAHNTTFTLLPQIHSIMAVYPTRNFEYALGKRKKEPNFCQ